MRSPIRRTAAAAVIALALIACGGADDSSSATDDAETAAPATDEPATDQPTADEPTAADQPVSDEPAASDGATDDAVIQTAVNFAFEHEMLEVATGSTISFTVAEGSHSFTSTDAGFDTGILSGETVAVTVDAEPGTYGFRCTLHGQMTGEITVTG